MNISKVNRSEFLAIADTLLPHERARLLNELQAATWEGHPPNYRGALLRWLDPKTRERYAAELAETKF